MGTATGLELGEAATTALTSRYEQHLLQPQWASAGARAVPAVVVTGFLGSGKTTLVQHLLDAGGGLRIGVLVNEAGQVDVDSALLNARQRNAAVGVRPVDLSGGCACCAVSGAFGDALAALVGGRAYQELDLLLVETSGAADAGALASALAGGGFLLDSVMCVVDAEAGAEMLRAAEAEEAPGGGGGGGVGGVALAQLRAADLVVINKVDLATLGQISDLEDALRRINPSARLLRCRFGQVPPETALGAADAPPPGAAAVPEVAGGAAPEAAAPGWGVGDGVTGGGGGEGFLSHEGLVARPTPRAGAGARPRPRLLRQQQGERAGDGGSHSTDQASRLQDAAPAHAGAFESVSVVLEEGPLCMACFQAWVAERLLRTPGLLRAKGVVWLSQRRRARYVFHLSGRARAECRAEGPWQGPPGTLLVLIGQSDAAAAAAAAISAVAAVPMLAGEDATNTCGRNGTHHHHHQHHDHHHHDHHHQDHQQQHEQQEQEQGQEQQQHEGDRGGVSALEALRRSLLGGCVWGRCACCDPDARACVDAGAAPSGEADAFAAAREFRRVLEAHPRLHLLPPNGGGSGDAMGARTERAVGVAGAGTHVAGGAGKESDTTSRGEDDSGLVEFSAEGVPLHGVVADLVNAQVLRAAGAAAAARAPGARFLCASGGAAPLSSLTGLAGAERPAAALQVAFRPWEGAPAGAAAWEALAGGAGAGAVLRRAYAHVTSCKCDVVAEMRLRKN